MTSFLNFLTTLSYTVVGLIIWVLFSIVILVVGVIMALVLPVIFVIFLVWLIYTDWSLDRDLEKQRKRVEEILK